MNRDRIEGHWKQMKGRARKSSGRWGVSAAAAIAALALGACDDKKKGPNPPAPKTSAMMEAVVAATPASDPSLPSADTALAAQTPADATTLR